MINIDDQIDTSLESLKTNPPQLVQSGIHYHIIAPQMPLPDGEGGYTMTPIITQLLSDGRPFILHSLDIDDDNTELSYVWDGDGADVHTVKGWKSQTPPTPVGSFITCRHFVPSQTNIDSDLHDITMKPSDHPYNQALPTLDGCNHPEMGTACPYASSQMQCQFYDPDPIQIPVHFKITTEEGEKYEMMVQSARLNQGQRTIQKIIIDSDGISDIHSFYGSYDEAENIRNDIVIQVKETAGSGGEIEEVTHETTRNSFLQGLIAK